MAGWRDVIGFAQTPAAKAHVQDVGSDGSFPRKRSSRPFSLAAHCDTLELAITRSQMLLEDRPASNEGSGLNHWQERNSMAPKRNILAKRQPWNKGLKVGQSDGLAPDQVKRIRGVLADRGIPGLRDLALFSTAIDTMLPGQDLLNLVVGDVQGRNGSIRPVIEIARGRGMPPVR